MAKELACMEGFITMRTVCAGGTYVKPKSGVHIEDLPGISCESLAAVEPGKYLSAQVFIDEKTNIAGQAILDEMRAHMENYVTERGAKEAGSIGTWGETYSAGVDTKVGLRVRTDGGAMLIPSVPRVWIQCEDAIADLVIKVKDGNNEVQEFTVAVAAGVETEVWLNFEAKTKTVDIYVEDDRFKPLGGSAEGTRYFAGCTGCSSHGMYHGIAGGGIAGETESDALYGIRAEVVLLCSIDTVACILLRRFRMAVKYKLGILLLEEWIASPRTNYFKIHSAEWAVGQMEKWQTIDLPQAMKIQIKGLAHFISQLDPSCVECGSGPSYTYAKP